MPSAPSYLCKDRHGGFLFRRIIPPPLRCYFQNRREIRKSLTTYHRPTAMRSARRLAVFLDEVFDKLSKELRDKYEKELLDAEETLDIKEQFFAAFLKVFDEATIAEIERDGMSPGIQALFDIVKANMDELDGLYDKHDLADIKLSKLNQLRRTALTEQAISDLEAELKLATGALSEVSDSTRASKPITSGLKLSQCWDKYRQEKIKTHAWKSAGTVSENDEAFRALLDIVGDTTANQFTKQQAIAFKEGMLDYPRGRFRGENATLSLDTARERIPQRLAHATASNRMTLIATFLEWATEHEHMAGNPFTTRLIPARDLDQEEREPFSTDDLKLIFNDKIFTEHKYRQEWQYWLPLLGLFTGARLEELCQLRVSDIQQSEVGHYICIGERPDFKIKTKNAVRQPYLRPWPHIRPLFHFY